MIAKKESAVYINILCAYKVNLFVFFPILDKKIFDYDIKRLIF